MTIGGGLVAVAMFTAIALGTSSPAWAEAINGSYTAQAGSDPAAVWTFTPCGNGCADVLFADGRTERATLDRGQWRVDEVGDASAIKCTADGTESPGSAHYSWDPTTLAGEVWATDDSGACGADPGTDTARVPFNLTPAN